MRPGAFITASICSAVCGPPFSLNGMRGMSPIFSIAWTVIAGMVRPAQPQAVAQGLWTWTIALTSARAR